jgi:hypothetical protein
MPRRHHRVATVRRWWPVPAALALAVVLTSGGCGGGSTPAATATGPAGSGSGGTQGPFPVTVTRTGGIAGFDDHLVVAADGSVTGSTKAGPVTCAVTAATATGLALAAATPPAGGSGVTSGVADAMVVTVAAGGHTAYLGGSAGNDAGSRAVNAFLADLTLPADERTLCR